MVTAAAGDLDNETSTEQSTELPVELKVEKETPDERQQTFLLEVATQLNCLCVFFWRETNGFGGIDGCLIRIGQAPCETALIGILDMDTSYEKARTTYEWFHT